MKKLTIALLTTLSLSSFAGAIRPGDYECFEFNQMLEEQGSLYIKYGILGISKGTIYANEKDARPCSEGYVRQMNLRTSDGSCQSGYMCITEAPHRY